MLGKVQVRRLGRSACGAATIVLGLCVTAPARAEFPPYGAVADAGNPAIASGRYPDPTRDGLWLNYVFYFDCGIGMWIGVAVTASDNGASSLANRAGRGEEFPPGPPPGAQRDAGDPNHAFNHKTSANFVFQHGDWIDTKTGLLEKSPKLCLQAPHAPAPPKRRDTEGLLRVSDEQPLFPDAYRGPMSGRIAAAPEKPNRLPSRPAYVPFDAHGVRTMNPEQGPIKIAIPR